MKTPPLIYHGTFGTHLKKNPSGTFSFTGEVPIGAPSFNDYESGIEWLASWIIGMNDEERQREIAINCAPILFSLIFNGLSKDCAICGGAGNVPVVKYYAGNIGTITDEPCHVCQQPTNQPKRLFDPFTAH